MRSIIAFFTSHCSPLSEQVLEVGGHAAEDQKQIRTSSGGVTEPSRISPHEVLHLRLIDTVQHLLGKNDKGKGRAEGLINFLSVKRGSLLERGLHRGFTVLLFLWGYP